VKNYSNSIRLSMDLRRVQLALEAINIISIPLLLFDCFLVPNVPNQKMELELILYGMKNQDVFVVHHPPVPNPIYILLYFQKINKTVYHAMLIKSYLHCYDEQICDVEYHWHYYTIYLSAFPLSIFDSLHFIYI